VSDCCPYIRVATDGLADDRTHDASSPHHPPWHYSSSLRLPLQCSYIHITADGLANDCTHIAVSPHTKPSDSCPHITDEQSNEKSNTDAYTEGYTLSVTLPHDKLAFSFADTPAFTFADFESFIPTNNIANDATDSDCTDFFTDTCLTCPDSKSCGIATTFHTSYSCYDHSTINRSTNRAGC